MVILIVGKSGAGKSTYAMRLAGELYRDGQPVVILDGDIERLRSGNKDFSDEGRRKHLEDVSDQAAEIESRDVIVIVAVMAPTRELRNMMKHKWKQSRLIYLPGGSLWKGTTYERPGFDEL